MEKTKTPKQIIQSYLEERAKNDPLFASVYAKPNKNINECFDYILSEAKKRGNAVCMSDDEVFGLAVHYYAEDYIKEKSKFFDLKLSDGKIVVIPLKSLEEFKKEGEIMHHCVFSNEYFKKKDSLILSARIGKKHIETVEVNLKTFSIVQSRGVCNRNTEYHDSIVKLVNNNMNLIQKS